MLNPYSALEIPFLAPYFSEAKGRFIFFTVYVSGKHLFLWYISFLLENNGRDRVARSVSDSKVQYFDQPELFSTF